MSDPVQPPMPVPSVPPYVVCEYDPDGTLTYYGPGPQAEAESFAVTLRTEKPASTVEVWPLLPFPAAPAPS